MKTDAVIVDGAHGLGLGEGHGLELEGQDLAGLARRDRLGGPLQLMVCLPSAESGPPTLEAGPVQRRSQAVVHTWKSTSLAHMLTASSPCHDILPDWSTLNPRPVISKLLAISAAKT